VSNEKHLLLTILGSYTTGTEARERWQVGVRLALVFGTVDAIGTLPSDWEPVAATLGATTTDFTTNSNWLAHRAPGNEFDPVDYLTNEADPAVRTWINAMPKSCSAVRVDELKLSPIVAPSGHVIPAPPYAVGTPATLTYTGFIPRGATNAAMSPPQNSVVASHRTAQIGRHGRGRMYLPPLLQSVVGSDGRLDSGQNASIATAQATFLEDLRATAGLAGGAHVRAIVTGKPWSAYALINQVQVGDVMDTQRRRRRALIEVRANAPVAP
jgi:hypothetical protein